MVWLLWRGLYWQSLIVIEANPDVSTIHDCMLGSILDRMRCRRLGLCGDRRSRGTEPARACVSKHVFLRRYPDEIYAAVERYLAHSPLDLEEAQGTMTDFLLCVLIATVAVGFSDLCVTVQSDKTKIETAPVGVLIASLGFLLLVRALF